ncbi:MAG: DUF4147 domain-containing protein [Pirellulales bacterium]
MTTDSHALQILIDDALTIWAAGVEAVKPDRLIRDQTSLDGSWMTLADEELDLSDYRRILVVGAGKASGAMAAALWQHRLSQVADRIRIDGWINAPEGSFRPGSAGPIHLHAARPAGINIPTPQAVAGTAEIIRRMQTAGPDTLCVVLLSGGGSAILVSPVEGIESADKQLIATAVASAGGNIEQLNTVRRALSRVKGGGLLRGCRAARVVSLILSDVLGDPLETIASGPTVLGSSASPQAALKVLDDLQLSTDPRFVDIVRVLRARAAQSNSATRSASFPADRINNLILANNATAVDAAGVRAVELGYRYVMQSARASEGDVADLSLRCADATLQVCREREVDCWISGGEPTVKLPTRERCGIGGRNQQLALLTGLRLHQIMHSRTTIDDESRTPFPYVFLSGGTDGEDGPTDAAGAWVTSETIDRALAVGLDPVEAAARCDAYSFFHSLGNLIRSGPTGTNVCDLRIALAPSQRWLSF